MAPPPLQPSAIIMAAGKGTRMNSDLPKVMHPVAGRPMVHWVVDAAFEAGAGTVVLVVGHGAETVEAAFAGERRDVRFVLQQPQLGTGHAVDQARPLFEQGRLGAQCLVLCGDGPLIRAETLRTLLGAHRAASAGATLATGVLPDPSGYGRIVRTPAGGLARIVEEKDASAEERAIREVNPSYYCFDTAALFGALRRVDNRNRAGEYYLTDVFPLLAAEGRPVVVVDAVPAEDVQSINTPAQLADVDRILRARRDAAGSARPAPAHRG
ncbi:MAG: NTP transferase domain-containing protein [Phycisphaerales bacterium]